MMLSLQEGKTNTEEQILAARLIQARLMHPCCHNGQGAQARKGYVVCTASASDAAVGPGQ